MSDYRRDLMAEHRKRFGCDKPIVGCLHLRALPGTPMWDRTYSIEQHVEDLKKEADILQNLGFDAVVFANEADFPYVENIGPGALAAYTRIVTEVSRGLKIPFGVGIMNDPIAAISVAKATGAVFCRGFFAGQQVGNYGPVVKTPGEIFRYAKSIGADDVAVYTSFEPHNGYSLDRRTTEQMYQTLYQDAPFAGYSMNGPLPGEKIEDCTIARCKRLNPNIPVSCNNHTNAGNIKEILKIADMVVVGTALKKDHYLYNPVDYDNAKEFIEAAKG